MIFVVGGGGGLSINDALLHINAPVGSTITLAKGGVTVATLAASKGHTNSDGITADWYYSVNSSNYGTWTVTAAKDGETVTGTVTIDSAKQYDVELTYNLYLIKNGVIKVPYGISEKGVTIEQYTDSVGVVFSNDGRAFWMQLTAEVLGGMHYRTFVADFKAIPPQPNSYIYWGIRTVTSGRASTGWLANLQSSNSMEFPNHSEIDISSTAYENQYAAITCAYATRACDVINIYLVR